MAFDATPLPAGLVFSGDTISGSAAPGTYIVNLIAMNEVGLDSQALVIVNRGGAIGSEVMTLARAIQESVYGRFGIRLEPEPVVV